MIDVVPKQRTAYLFVTATAVLILAFMSWEYLLDLPLSIAARITLAIGALLLSLAYRTTARGAYSPSIVYMSLFGLFHLGLGFVTATGAPIRSNDQLRYLRTWYFDSILTTEATLLAGLGFVSLVWGMASTYLRPIRSVSRDRTAPWLGGGSYSAAANQKVYLAGSLILTTASLTWFAVAFANGGSRLLFGSYTAWLSATHGVPVWWIYLIMGIGLCMVAATAQDTRRLILASTPFAAFAILGLPLGLRGEVLFPLAGAIAVYGIQRKPPRVLTVFLLVVVSLMGIATLRAIRTGGLSAVSGDVLTMSPTEGLIELGSSLRPTWEVLRWREAGEPYLGGATYAAPFDRAFSRIIPGGIRLPAEQDVRLMNITVVQRTGSELGFSPVAEAHRNFGTLGVFAVMAVLGHIIGLLDGLGGLKGRLVLGVVLVPLLINVRNSFTALPAQIAFGVLIVLLILTWAQETSSQARTPYGPR